MICAKCKKEAPEGASYCPWCGRLIGSVPKKKAKRGNGTGSAFKKNGSWTVRVTAGFRIDPDDSHKIQVFRTKGGFKSKADALNYAETLRKGQSFDDKISMEAVYASWAESYEKRVGDSTMAGYRAAFKHFSKISFRPLISIRAEQLQKCMDDCPAGKRTKQLMRVVANLIYKYAIDNDIVEKNCAANLYTGNDETTTREPITELELQKIKEAIPSEPYAAYVVALCYLGFRPGEMLKLKKSSVHQDEGYIIGGGKTRAGTDRPVTIPPAIQQIIKDRMEYESDWLFPRLDTNKQMDHEFFREQCFDPLMKKLGITGKVPYSCRHTYSNLIKNAPGDDGDKARLMGHTDYTFTQQRYQASIIADLKKITDSLI